MVEDPFEIYFYVNNLHNKYILNGTLTGDTITRNVSEITNFLW